MLSFVNVFGFVDAVAVFLILTPITVAWLGWQHRKSAAVVAKRVEEVRVHTAIAAEHAAEKVAARVLEQTQKDKAEIDAKLETIRVEVNSNLSNALERIVNLQAWLSRDPDPSPTANQSDDTMPKI